MTSREACPIRQLHIKVPIAEICDHMRSPDCQRQETTLPFRMEGIAALVIFPAASISAPSGTEAEFVFTWPRQAATEEDSCPDPIASIPQTCVCFVKEPGIMQNGEVMRELGEVLEPRASDCHRCVTRSRMRLETRGLRVKSLGTFRIWGGGGACLLC